MAQEPEDQKGEVRVELGEIDAINNLDTARMALRWALERLHSLEKLKAELAESAELKTRLHAEAEGEKAALARTLAQKELDGRRRELYYQKLEEFVSLRLAGQLDAKALIERDVETSNLLEFLQHRQATLEKEYAAKREDLEREYQRLRVEAAQESSRRLQEDELGLAQRRKALEKEHLSTGSELRERESVLRKEELSLEERRSRFSEFYKSQRSELDEGFRDLQEEAAERADIRVRKAEEQYQRRLSEKEAAWTLERDTLSTALSEWRRKAEELFALTQEFERRSAAAEEASALARKAADFERTRREEAQRASEAEKGALVPSLELWKTKAQEHIARANDLERKIATVEAELVKARDRISNGEAHLESLQSSWEQESLMLSSELHQWKRKAEEQLERSLESGRRLEAAQAEMKLAQTAAESERARSEARLKEWEQRQTGLLAEQARLTQENSSWKIRADAQFSSILDLEKKVSSLEELAKLAQNAAESERSQLEARRAEWEQERTGLLREQARLTQENSSWKVRAEEQLSRTLALGRKLDESQAQARLAESSVLAERANIEARLKSWDQEKGEALKERTLLLSQAEDWKRLMEEQSARCMELERRLFETEETLAQSRNAVEIKDAQLQAQNAGWESEKAALQNEAEMLSGRIKEGKAREEQLRSGFMDAERRLFETEESLSAARTEGERLRAHLESERAGWEKESVELLREREVLLSEVEDWRRKHQERLSKTLDLERDLAKAKEEAAQAPRPAQIENAQLKARLDSWEKEKAALFPELEQWRRKADEQLERSLSLEHRLVAAQEELSRAQRPAELRQAQLEGERSAFTQERAALSKELDEWKEKSREQLAHSLELDRRLAAAREEALHAQSTAERHQERHAALETRWAQEISRLLLELHVNQKKMQDQFHLMMDLETRVASAQQAAASAAAPIELKNAALEAQRQSWEAEKAVLLPQLEDWKARAQTHFSRLTELETRLAAAQTQLAEAVEPGRLHDAQWEGRRAAWEGERAALLAERAGLSNELEDSRRRSLDIQSQVLELERKLAASLEEAQHAQSAAERQKERHASLETRWAREISGLLLELHAGGEKTRSQFETILDLENRLTASEEENQKLKSSPAALKSVRLEERRKALEDEKAGLILELTQWRQMADEHAAKTLELERKLVIAEQELGRSRQSARIEESRLQAQRQALEEERSRLAPELEKWRQEAALGAERLTKIEAELAAAREKARGGLRPLKTENSALESRIKALEAERDTLASEMDFWKTSAAQQSSRLLELEKTLASLQEEAESHSSLRQEKSGWEAQRKGWDQERAALAAERERLDLELQRWRADAQEHLGRSEDLSRKLSGAQEGERSARDEAALERERARREREDWESEKSALLKERERLAAAAVQWRERAGEHSERRAELESGLAQAQGREDALLSRERERFIAELSSWRLKAQEHLAKAQEMGQRLASSEKSAEFAKSAAQLEHAQLETLREMWEQEKSILTQDQVTLNSEFHELKGKADENASKLHETERKLARAEEEAAQAKRPLEAKTARLEAQRQAWEAEKASLLQEQARLASENERWRAKAQDHSTRSQELAHRLADADKAAELARSAAQIEHAQAERLREIWEADKKLLLQDHLLLTSDLLELKGRSESHYSESRELERALSAARSELEQARRPLEVETARHEAERAAWEAERESLVHSHDSLRAELERWRGQAQSHRERVAELDSSLISAQEELANRDAPLRRKAEELEARRISWENERASLLEEGKRLGSELETWKLKAQEQLTRSQELGRKLRTAEEAARLAEGAVRLEQAQTETLKGTWEQEKAFLLREQERLDAVLSDWKLQAARHAERRAEVERRLLSAEESSQGARRMADAQGARLEAERLESEKERARLDSELERWRAQAVEQVARSQDLLKRLSAAENAAATARGAADIAEHAVELERSQAETSRRLWEAEKASLLPALERWRAAAEEQSGRTVEFERRLAAAEEEKKRLQGLSEAKGARLESERAALLQETRSLREELDTWRSRLQEQTERSLEIERKLAAAQEAALHAESSAQRHQERHASLETQWAREIGRLLQELRQSQDKARSQSDLILDLEKRLDEAVPPPKPRRRK